MIHAYERSPCSGAGNCHCGMAEHSRVHPHHYAAMDINPMLCVCAWPFDHPIHTGGERPQPRLTGTAGIREAIRIARGTDSAPQQPVTFVCR